MILFVDIEVNQKGKIVDLGSLSDLGDKIHSNKIEDHIRLFKKSDFLAGHNIIKHDLFFLKDTVLAKYIKKDNIIDSLMLSTLMFPDKPYHALIKDDKLQIEEMNNPLFDASKSFIVFNDCVSEFNKLDADMKEIYFNLLKEELGFSGFFRAIKYNRKNNKVLDLIKNKFNFKICGNSNLDYYIKKNPIELAYVLALITSNNIESLLPAWVLKQYSMTEEIIQNLRGTPCGRDCNYCRETLNPIKALNRYFDYPSFRTFEGFSLQEAAVTSALKQESLIAVFPTGGGKSLTFQLPALMARDSTRGLTVVISPLQSLMKDQVDNLEKRSITNAVYINGLLDPIERSKVFERVSDGSASLLYISPEALRSKAIEAMLISRHIVRFVIDEAHCFSTWGHDFRVDYLYIGEFIKKVQEVKGLKKAIPVSCFTATAKKNVIEDILKYFNNKLELEMKVFQTKSSRRNLKYKVIEIQDENQKYDYLRNLIDSENTPTIIYASRRTTVEKIYGNLKRDNFEVSFFHGGLESDTKMEQQNQFMSGETRIMVATSAFGMGVDKSDIGCVIHYEISDSLENYVQEAGRAGRNEDLKANCYILYNEDDLNKHFELLNNSKLNIKEIQSIWKGVKDLTKYRDSISQSALEIARAAGWDETDQTLSTKVTTAIATLEDAGFVKRGNNSPRLFANSILAKSVIEANKKIEESNLFSETEKILAKRVIDRLIKSKYKSKAGNEEAESRIDYLSDILGVKKEDIIRVVILLKEIRVLNDDKDLNASIKPNYKSSTAMNKLTIVSKNFRFLLNLFTEEEMIYNIKNLNEFAIKEGIETNTKEIRKTINYLDVSKYIKIYILGKDNFKIKLNEKREKILNDLEKKITISVISVNYLFNKLNKSNNEGNKNLVSFSILELKENYMSVKGMFDYDCSIKDVEDVLYFLHKLQILDIEGGFMVIYSPLNIERIIKENKMYLKSDYKKMENYYEGKKQQIHIVGEYANKMIENYDQALKFVDDYFTEDYDLFLNRYFSGQRKKDINLNMSPKKFKQLFGELSKEQLEVILDKEHKKIAVSAGPGSGKTRLLVHKLASIIHTEDIKKEQLLMLTFSRAAVTEFKERLHKLIGPPSYYVDIKTFHSFAFDILGRVGDLEKTDTILKQATELINNDEADAFKITKAVLVIDEAQDMSKEEFELVEALIKYNENLRVIAVGDDDQNIYEFRGSNSNFFKSISEEDGKFYELSTNFRAKKNLVQYSNQLINKISSRLKIKPIKSYTEENGNIKYIQVTNDNYNKSVVKTIIEENLEGTTCVITRTNESAFEVTGLLNKNGIDANLIQNNDDFRLFNLKELNHFYKHIYAINNITVTDRDWSNSIELFKVEFNQSANLSICLKILNGFRKTFDKFAYLSDFNEYLLESNFSDFKTDSKVTVSTYHKAKGKEFDNVYLINDSKGYLKEDEIRALYVGITRAKNNLRVFSNNEIFNTNSIGNYQRDIDDSIKEKNVFISVILNHRDVRLGYFNFIQHNIEKLHAGYRLMFDGNHLTFNGRRVLELSAKSKNQISGYLEQGYILVEAYVKYLVYWYDEENKKSILIVLPELIFEDAKSK